MNKLTTTIIAILLVIMLALGGAYFWFSTSVFPAYSNFSIAVKSKNLDEVKKYVDIDILADSYVGSAKAVIGDLFTKESATKTINESITAGKFVKDSNLVSSQLEAYSSGKLVADGADYRLKVDLYSSSSSDTTVDADLYFTKEAGSWKVTKVKIDFAKIFSQAISNQKQPETKTNELKIGSEATTTKFKIKVTALEFVSTLETKQAYSSQPTILKPLTAANIFAKISFEATNVSNTGSYFSLLPSIRTADGKVFKPDYRENMYLFEKVSTDKKSLDLSSMLNPSEKGYGIKIIEIPGANKEKSSVLIEDMEGYPNVAKYIWSN